MTRPTNNMLGAFLRNCRERIDPAKLGLPATRRRTPGLRREEVAQRANVSATWYTWLEQGRGGGPSPEVLERVSRALTLSVAEREHLFQLAQHLPPERSGFAPESVSAGLQRTMDAFELSPTLVKNGAWDIVGWNRAAALILTDYAALPPRERNILRLLFTNPTTRAAIPDWESEARFAVARFRLESGRAGAGPAAVTLVDELRQASAEFSSIWNDNEVSTYGEGIKHIVHPAVGRLALEYSSFAVDGQPKLGMIVYTPATPADRRRIKSVVTAAAKLARPQPPQGTRTR